MTDVLENSIVEFVNEFLRGGQPADILMPESYYCPYAAAAILKNFPRLEFGVLNDDLPLTEKARGLDPTWHIRPLMVGSIGGMCMLYLRVSRSSPSSAAQFGKAKPLVVNYDAGTTGRSLSCLVDERRVRLTPFT